jgi:hypothetical protein
VFTFFISFVFFLLLIFRLEKSKLPITLLF